MEHVDDAARRQTRRDAGRRTAGGSRRNAVTTAEWISAGIGLVLTAAVGIATVTITLTESGGGTTEVPGVSPAPADVGPGPLSPWGLRLTPQGQLVPAVPSDSAPRTALEELYSELLRPPVP